jgi:ABC-2 type transport system permease protein
MNLSNISSHRNRALLRELVATDFKLRYQGSALGYMWSLFRPLFLFGILYIVFGYFARFGGNIDHYPLYLLLGIVLWNFFVEATNNGLQSIVSRGDLIRKINFPKYIIVISGSVSALINLGISLIVVFVFVLAAGVHLRPVALLLPFLIAELYVFALALAFFLSALYVKYRDISYIWELVMQAGIYATPIIYPLSLVVAKSPLAAKLMLLNPIAQIIQDARFVLVTPQTETLLKLSHNWLAIVAPPALILLTIVTASLYFRASAKYFAENV